MTLHDRSLAWLLPMVLTACVAEDGPGDASEVDCAGGKCDVPSDAPELSCAKRQAEVLDSSNRGFTPEGIRWACADVDGVNANTSDDRGKEYCEYYAIVHVPGAAEAVDLGRRRAADGSSGLAICVEGDESSACRTVITEDQLFELEDEPDRVVGTCVFTSWHSEADAPFPGCTSADDCTEALTLFGFPMTADNARMLDSFNSNGAAVDLVAQCFDAGSAVPEPDFDDPDDPNRDPFFRGCMTANRLFSTEWRRSDSSICAAVNRLRECGCVVEGVSSPRELGRAVVGQPGAPAEGKTRGFALGTWDDPHGLPPGCRHAEGDDSRTLVACDLTAADVVANLADPKEACRVVYGDNVVAHVDLPVEAIVCEATDRFGQACGAMPWNLGDEDGRGP
jgi:hypothetical protein